MNCSARVVSFLLVLAVVFSVVHPALAQPCQGQWLPGEGPPGFDGTVYSSAMWDPDGPGPNAAMLVLGGTFTRAGATPANNIVGYDLSTGEWSAFGPGVSDPQFVQVRALATLPNGELVAAGHFATIGSDAVNNIARWDGTAWRALGLGLAGSSSEGGVNALTVLANGDLIVGGDFTSAGGVAARGVARWNHDIWSAMDAGLSACCISIRPVAGVFAVSPSGVLYVAGALTATGSTSSRVARWNGTAWAAIASTTTNGAVTALCFMPNGDLILGGQFTMAGSVAVNNITRWNGSAWFALGTGITNVTGGGGVKSLLALADGSVVAVGGFQTAGGVTVNGVARWLNNTWTGLGTGFTRSPFSAIAYSIVRLPGDDLCVGGDFLIAGGTSAYRAAIWSGNAWSGLGAGIRGGSAPPAIRAMTKLASGEVVVGGTFTSAGSMAMNRVAKWDGVRWSAMGAGMNNFVWALDTAPNGDVIAGGPFTAADGTSCPGVAKWNGVAWSSVGGGVAGQFPYVESVLALPSGEVIIGGSFSSAGGTAASCIAKWDGTAWTALGLGMSGVPFGGLSTVSELKRLPNGDIIAGGNFTSAGGTPARCIARWDGVAWAPLGEGISERVHALAVLPNGDIIAGGWFSTAGGLPANRIARWDGVAWSAMGAGMAGTPGGGGDVDVTELLVRPNGDLIVGGYFTTAGSATAYSLARWNGVDWLPLGQGVRGTTTSAVFALMSLTDNEFAVGGSFDTTTGVLSSYFSRWTETNVPWIARQSQAVQVMQGDMVTLAAVPANGYSNVRVQWRRNGVNITDGAGGASPSGGVVSGASHLLASPTRGSTAMLTITESRPSDAGAYTAAFSNDCGEVVSEAAGVAVAPACVADVDDGSGMGTPDGGVTIEDLLYYLGQYVLGAMRADLDDGSGTGTPDGGVTIDDLLYYLARYELGC